jgi:HEAT repeat protein
MSAALLALALVALAAPVRADDRVDALTPLLSSSNEKTRVQATISLARLGGRRVLKPLVTALHDPSPTVRAIAATALGHLAHKAALPSLRALATDDGDEHVRAKARQAAIEVAKANDLPDELPPLPGAPAPAQARHASGFGRTPHVVEEHADLFVTIKSARDDSPGNADATTRKANADFLRETLTSSFGADPQVTMVEADAQRWGLDARHIDLSVTKLTVDQSGPTIEVDCQLRLAISDDSGKMLSFLSGGAKASVPRAKFKLEYLPDLRKQALEGAMRGMFDKLLAHLRQTQS